MSVVFFARAVTADLALGAVERSSLPSFVPPRVAAIHPRV
jgi:hypothetical protein